MEHIIVNIAGLRVASPPYLLVTYALGSCVAVCLQDPVARVGGMAHIMLPSPGALPAPSGERGRYASTAIPDLLYRMELSGAKRDRIQAKLAGGAKMYGEAEHSFSDVGQRNVSAAVVALYQLNIPIAARDVLGRHERTVLFDPSSGEVAVTSHTGPCLRI